MKPGAKKIQAAARVEGEESLRYIQCDLYESRGHPIAVLFWPDQDGRFCTCPLESSELSPSDTAGVSHVYTGEPLPIPKDLYEIWKSAEPLSPDGLRLGFFFLQ